MRVVWGWERRLGMDRKRDTNCTDFHEWDFEQEGTRKRRDGRNMGGREMGSTGRNGENGVVAKR